MKKIVLLITTLVLAACGATPTATAPSALTYVKLAMGYIPDVQFAPYYVAAEKGYFAEQGIEIEFVTMFENDAVPLLGTNEMQFANVSAEQIIQARAQGLPVVYVMKWWEKYPVAVVAKQSSGIESPSDLVGRTIGLPGPFGATYIGLRALLATQNIDESEVTLDSIGFTQVEALATNKDDAVVGYANNEPIRLAAAGEAINVFYVADYVSLASNGLATNEKTIAENPQLVQGMVTAILKGLADTMANPDAAFEISSKYVEPLATADAGTLAAARDVLSASIAMWQTTALGRSDLARWETTEATLLSIGLIAEPIDLQKAFTNDFIK